MFLSGNRWKSPGPFASALALTLGCSLELLGEAQLQQHGWPRRGVPILGLPLRVSLSEESPAEERPNEADREGEAYIVWLVLSCCNVRLGHN